MQPRANTGDRIYGHFRQPPDQTEFSESEHEMREVPMPSDQGLTYRSHGAGSVPVGSAVPATPPFNPREESGGFSNNNARRPRRLLRIATDGAFGNNAVSTGAGIPTSATSSGGPSSAACPTSAAAFTTIHSLPHVDEDDDAPGVAVDEDRQQMAQDLRKYASAKKGIRLCSLLLVIFLFVLTLVGSFLVLIMWLLFKTIYANSAATARSQVLGTVIRMQSFHNSIKQSSKSFEYGAALSPEIGQAIPLAAAADARLGRYPCNATTIVPGSSNNSAAITSASVLRSVQTIIRATFVLSHMAVCEGFVRTPVSIRLYDSNFTALPSSGVYCKVRDHSQQLYEEAVRESDRAIEELLFPAAGSGKNNTDRRWNPIFGGPIGVDYQSYFNITTEQSDDYNSYLGSHYAMLAGQTLPHGNETECPWGLRLRNNDKYLLLVTPLCGGLYETVLFRIGDIASVLLGDAPQQNELTGESSVGILLADQSPSNLQTPSYFQPFKPKLAFHSLSPKQTRYEDTIRSASATQFVSTFREVCQLGTKHTLHFTGATNENGQFIASNDAKPYQLGSFAAPGTVVLCAAFCTAPSPFIADRCNPEDGSTVFVVAQVTIFDGTSQMITTALLWSSIPLMLVMALVLAYIQASVAAPVYVLQRQMIDAIVEKPTSMTCWWQRLVIKTTQFAWSGDMLNLMRFFRLIGAFALTNRKHTPEHILKRQRMIVRAFMGVGFDIVNMDMNHIIEQVEKAALDNVSAGPPQDSTSTASASGRAGGWSRQRPDAVPTPHPSAPAPDMGASWGREGPWGHPGTPFGRRDSHTHCDNQRLRGIGLRVLQRLQAVRAAFATHRPAYGPFGSNPPRAPPGASYQRTTSREGATEAPTEADTNATDRNRQPPPQSILRTMQRQNSARRLQLPALLPAHTSTSTSVATSAVHGPAADASPPEALFSIVDGGGRSMSCSISMADDNALSPDEVPSSTPATVAMGGTGVTVVDLDTLQSEVSRGDLTGRAAPPSQTRRARTDGLALSTIAQTQSNSNVRTLNLSMGASVTSRRAAERITEREVSLLVIKIASVADAYATSFSAAAAQHNKLYVFFNAILRRHRGEVFLRTGDTIICAWNAFDTHPDHTLAAMRCAVDIAAAVAQSRREGLRIGIAVHVDVALCGTLGDHKMAAPVVFGDALDLVDRVGELSRELPYFAVLITEPVRTAVSIFYHCIIVDVVKLGERSAPTVIFDVLGIRGENDPLPTRSPVSPSTRTSATDRHLLLYNNAFARFRSHQFADALTIIGDLQRCITDCASGSIPTADAPFGQLQPPPPSAPFVAVSSLTATADPKAAVERLRQLCTFFDKKQRAMRLFEAEGAVGATQIHQLVHNDYAHLPNPYSRVSPKWSVFERIAEETLIRERRAEQQHGLVQLLPHNRHRTHQSASGGEDRHSGNDSENAHTSSTSRRSQNVGRSGRDGTGAEQTVPTAAAANLRAVVPASPASVFDARPGLFGKLSPFVLAAGHDEASIQRAHDEEESAFKEELRAAANQVSPRALVTDAAVPGATAAPSALASADSHGEAAAALPPVSPLRRRKVKGHGGLRFHRRSIDSRRKMHRDGRASHDHRRSGLPRSQSQSALPSDDDETFSFSPSGSVSKGPLHADSDDDVSRDETRQPPVAQVLIRSCANSLESTRTNSPLGELNTSATTATRLQTEDAFTPLVTNGTRRFDEMPNLVTSTSHPDFVHNSASQRGLAVPSSTLVPPSNGSDRGSNSSGTVAAPEVHSVSTPAGGATDDRHALIASCSFNAINGTLKDFTRNLENITPKKLPVEIITKNKTIFTRSDTLLGAGSYGKVFLGMEKHTGKLVAMKFMPLPDDPDEVAKIETEVTIMQRVHDQYLVDFYGYSFVAPYIVLVMECVVAGSLASMLKSFEVFDQQTVVNFMKHVLRGLSKLHREGIIHRDVKPQNVLVTTNGLCKISDFGAAARISALVRSAADGEVIQGTPLYLSPEAAQGHPVTRSDIWSVGVMFLQLITGKLPYEVDDVILSNPCLFAFNVGAGRISPRIPVEDLSPQALEFVHGCIAPLEKRLTADELLGLPFFLL